MVLLMSIKIKEFLEYARKEKASLVLSIISIIVAFGFPVLSIIFGIFGLVLANSHQKESGLDYKTERIVSIVGIVVSVLNWIIGIFLHMS